MVLTGSPATQKRNQALESKCYKSLQTHEAQHARTAAGFGLYTNQFLWTVVCNKKNKTTKNLHMQCGSLDDGCN